ncbi:GNAT family N-acetyltransferase [Fodinicurvata fenggangensis]|uniref:GNAT family N-acetyltransferase n=1 Tax=Fodinicurvata fenggangensis TaxID=1121830 RepID=UPI00047AB3FE
MTAIIRLNESHLDAVIALHHEVVRDMPRALAARESDAFFHEHMTANGQIFGAFKDSQLIAYGVLGLPRPGDPNFGRDHGLPEDELSGVAHIDGVAVRADQRGYRWQYRMVQHRLQAARKAGRRIALSTVAPENFASVVNTLSAGLTIRGLIDKFGGKRFLLRRDLKDQKAAESLQINPGDIGTWCPCNDTARCRELLDAGYQGVTCHKATQDAVPEIGWKHLDFM